MKVHANGIGIHYEPCGSGPVVMFAHAPGSDLSLWNAQKGALARATSSRRMLSTTHCSIFWPS